MNTSVDLVDRREVEMTVGAKSSRYFAVTTPGLTATRWLSHVLASHPDVYVAHGKFALDSVIAGDFHKEKETAHLESLTRGNQTREFYEQRSLEEVLALYRGIKPGARAHGCVHSYTMHTLAQAAQHPDTLANVRVVNVVRHPVDFIASHESLVRAAEKHPRLYQSYLDEVFPQVLREFPELYLMRCPEFRAFFAFAISCRAVSDLLYDMCYPNVRHLKMEALTTQVDVLSEFCAELTGVAYAKETLDEYIRLGAINRHRAGTARRQPHETYAAWAPWQQDIAQMMISGLVLDWLETLGYDLSMLEAQAAPASAGKGTEAPCLADCLRSMDQRHPLLAFMTPKGRERKHIVEADLQGFHMTRHEGKFYAMARTQEIGDISKLDDETLQELHEDGLCVGGASIAEVWQALALVLGSNPQLIEEYHGYNLIMFRKVCYAAPLGLALDLDRLTARERKQLIRNNRLIAGGTPVVVKQQIDALAP
ncbi:MAG TPA: hypothetical protein VNX28_02790 [Gemmataceae bacterium]|jgi:hypothetical protein|nr:hypothetical protein [Gemmataceae bacterium]